VFEPAPPPTVAIECKFRRLLVPAEPTQGVHQGCRTRRLQGGMLIQARIYRDILREEVCGDIEAFRQSPYVLGYRWED